MAWSDAARAAAAKTRKRNRGVHIGAGDYVSRTEFAKHLKKARVILRTQKMPMGTKHYHARVSAMLKSQEGSAAFQSKTLKYARAL